MIAKYVLVNDTNSAGWVLRDLLLGAEFRTRVASALSMGFGSCLGLRICAQPGADRQRPLLAIGGRADAPLVLSPKSGRSFRGIVIAAGVAENQSFSATMNSFITRTSCEHDSCTNVFPFQERTRSFVDSQEKVCGLAGLL